MDLNELLARCVEVEKEAILEEFAQEVDAVPYFIHQQEAFPYITNGIRGDEIGFDSNEMDRHTINITIRLIVGHLTEGYKGSQETLLYSYIPVIVTAFNTNEGLVSAAYPDDMEGLIEGDTARLQSHSGVRLFQDGGLSGVQQVGTEFVLTCLFNEELYSEE